MTPDVLREQWRTRRATAPLRAEMTFEDDALVLGAGAVLAKTAATCGVSDDARLAALLSVAHRRPISPRALAHIRRAVVKKREGETTLALVHLALSGVAKLERPEEDARRIFVADELMTAGIAPRAVSEAFSRFDGALDDLERRYDPDQPRVPAGNGRASGQWTSGDWAGSAAASGSAPPSNHPAANQTSTRPIQIADSSSNWFRYLDYLKPIGEAHAQAAEAEPEREENEPNSEEKEPFVTYFDPETGRYYEYPRANRPPAGWVNMERLPRGPMFIGPSETEADQKPEEGPKEPSQTEEVQTPNRREQDEPDDRKPKPPNPATAITAGAAIAAANRAAQLARNRAVGRAFEQKTEKEIAGSGQKIVPQITLKDRKSTRLNSS